MPACRTAIVRELPSSYVPDMGLTIHYQFEVRRRLSLAGVRRLLEPLRDKAVELGFEEVGPWIQLGPDYPCLYFRPPGAKRFSDCLPPAAGWLFHAIPGDGCESVAMGLARYPGVAGWQLEGFCKTQYASRYGWDHFLRCHLAVVLLLSAAESAGLRVTVFRVMRSSDRRATNARRSGSASDASIALPLALQWIGKNSPACAA